MIKNIRTDLAVESSPPKGSKGAEDGIKTVVTVSEGFSVTETEVAPGVGEEVTGRKAGLYITVDTGRLWLEDSLRRHSAVRLIKELLIKLMPADLESGVLVVGLGNEDITADSIGPETAARLVVTHHMRRLDPSLYDALSFGDLAAVVPKVLGQTGVESSVLVRAAAQSIKPACVIAVDALAARSLARLATTVQLTCAGIAPGSGVCNSREELSGETIGCPVIAVGVPTVVDVPTLLWEHGGEPQKGSEGYFVTPKETDVMTRVMAEVIAAAINGAVHRNTENVEEYAPL